MAPSTPPFINTRSWQLAASEQHTRPRSQAQNEDRPAGSWRALRGPGPQGYLPPHLTLSPPPHYTLTHTPAPTGPQAANNTPEFHIPSDIRVHMDADALYTAAHRTPTQGHPLDTQTHTPRATAQTPVHTPMEMRWSPLTLDGPQHIQASPYTPRQTCPQTQGPRHSPTHCAPTHQEPLPNPPPTPCRCRAPPPPPTGAGPLSQGSSQGSPRPIHTHLTHTHPHQQVAGPSGRPSTPFPGTPRGLPSASPCPAPRVYDLCTELSPEAVKLAESGKGCGCKFQAQGSKAETGGQQATELAGGGYWGSVCTPAHPAIMHVPCEGCAGAPWGRPGRASDWH